MAAKRTVLTDTVEEITGTVKGVSELSIDREIKPIDGVLEYRVVSLMKINYGDFESHHAGGEVFGRFSADLDIDEVGSMLDEKLFSLMRPQLEAAKDFAIKDSFVRKIETG